MGSGQRRAHSSACRGAASTTPSSIGTLTLALALALALALTLTLTSLMVEAVVLLPGTSLRRLAFIPPSIARCLCRASCGARAEG